MSDELLDPEEEETRKQLQRDLRSAVHLNQNGIAEAVCVDTDVVQDGRAVTEWEFPCPHCGRLVSVMIWSQVYSTEAIPDE